MNYLVGYNNTAEAEKALNLASEQAKLTKAKVFLLTSMEGGAAEKLEEVEGVELKTGRSFSIK